MKTAQAIKVFACLCAAATLCSCVSDNDDMGTVDAVDKSDSVSAVWELDSGALAKDGEFTVRDAVYTDGTPESVKIIYPVLESNRHITADINSEICSAAMELSFLGGDLSGVSLERDYDYAFRGDIFSVVFHTRYSSVGAGEKCLEYTSVYRIRDSKKLTFYDVFGLSPDELYVFLNEKAVRELGAPLSELCGTEDAARRLVEQMDDRLYDGFSTWYDSGHVYFIIRADNEYMTIKCDDAEIRNVRSGA